MRLLAFITELQEYLVSHGDIYVESVYDCCCFGSIDGDPELTLGTTPNGSTVLSISTAL